MMRRRRLIAIVLLLSLTMALAFLFNRTRAVDIEAQNRVMLNLRELEKLDAEWNVNILRSHIGLNPDYDPLSAPLPRMHTLVERLGSALPDTDHDAALRTYTDLQRSLREKEELVEQFKPQNAILRNSLNFFPPALTDLKTELNGIEGATVPSRTVLALDGMLNVLLTDVLRFNQTPDPRVGVAIEHNVQGMLALRAAFSPAVADSIDTLAAHARAIVHYRQLENTLEARIAHVGLADATARLASLFDRAYDQTEISKQRFRSYLAVYSVVLLILLMYFAWRLRRSYRIINEVNFRLQGANETLEQRVAERTTELEAQSARLQQLALHDGLTGLINYGQLTQLLDHALVRAGRRGTIVVIMFIDLDGFKAVNDTWGHATGDLVLKAVAKQVQDKLRKEDALARLGGDEFVILLDEVSSREGALRVAELALEQIRAITEAGGHPVRISASIGVSSAVGAEGAARGAAALLADADQAMYQAKDGGKNGVVVSANAKWGTAAPVRPESAMVQHDELRSV